MSILLLNEGAGGPAVPLPVQSGLLAMYRMDEGGGQTLLDSSGAARDAILGSTAGADTNDPAWVAAGLSFSTDDYVGCEAYTAMRPNAWTVCVATKLAAGVVNPVLGWHTTSQVPAVFGAAPFNQNRPLIWLANNCFRYFEKNNPVNIQDGVGTFGVYVPRQHSRGHHGLDDDGGRADTGGELDHGH
ncbi:MAG: hypothetical protein R2748_23225 [Bryobacterales bacterium]